MAETVEQQRLFHELKQRFPEVPDDEIKSLMVKNEFNVGKCYSTLGQESNRYLYGEQTADRQRSSSGGSCASGRDSRVRSDSVESGSSAGSNANSGANIPRPVFYPQQQNSNYPTGSPATHGNYLYNPPPYHLKQVSTPAPSYSYNNAIYPPAGHISTSASTGNLPEHGAAGGQVHRVHTSPEISPGYGYSNHFGPQGQSRSMLLVNPGPPPQSISPQPYVTSQQRQYPVQHPPSIQYQPPSISGEMLINTTRPSPSRPDQFNQGFPPGVYSAITHNAVSPQRYQQGARGDQHFQSPSTNQVNIYPQPHSMTSPPSGPYSSSVYIDIKNNQSPSYGNHPMPIPQRDLLASTDPEIHKVTQQPIVPSPASSHSSSKDFLNLNQNDVSYRRDVCQSPASFTGSEDHAYTQALLLHQKARKEKLEEDLNQRLNELEKLRREVHNMESRLLEDRKKENQFVSAEDIQKVRDTNRNLQIDIQLMTREIDMVNNGTMPLGIIEASEFQNFHQNIGTGQRGSIHGSRTPSSGSENSTSSRPPKPPRPPQPDISHYSTVYPSQNPPPTYVPRPPPAPEPIVDPDEGSHWSCKACTFLNHPALDKCEYCEMPKVSPTRSRLPQLGFDVIDTAR